MKNIILSLVAILMVTPVRIFLSSSIRLLPWKKALPTREPMIVFWEKEPAHAVRNVTFEDFRINGRVLYPDMPGKPRWYSTADYVPMYVGSHVENLIFTK